MLAKNQIILGIHDGHDCSSCIMVNGKIVYAAQEERYTKTKNDYGFPKLSIMNGLKYLNIKKKDIDLVALGTNFLNPVLCKIKRNANFSIENWIEEQELYWKPLKLKNKKVSYWNIFKNHKFKYDKHYDYSNINNTYMSKKDMEIFRERRINKISKFLHISKEKIKIITHEDCHKFYSYYFFGHKKPGVCVTAEGIGDYSSGSVSTIKSNKFNEIAFNLENHLGHIYQYITLLLGLKPTHHEYKVMGLAPYANDYEIKKSYKIFADVLKVNKLNVVFNKKPKDLYFHFREKLKFCRFDGIAGGVQKFVEEILSKWFENIIKKTKTKNIYFSGGVAQNIKAGLALSKNKWIKKIYIPPAAGDTSISLGATYFLRHEFCKENNLNYDKLISPINNLYLGNKIIDNDIVKAMKKNNRLKKFNIKKNTNPKKIAQEISKGKIIGRCSGRMEFGLRSLGNRSILCDPRYYENINKINSKIKKRDFWMPFTPTILDKDFKKYCDNPKNLEARFMTMAFDTTKVGRKSIPAAIHPADFTARPQMLRKIDNPEYYEIIENFKKITGVGALLNTSLNLHGLPIVESAEDAFYVLENSDLDILILESYTIKKLN